MAGLMRREPRGEVGEFFGRFDKAGMLEIRVPEPSSRKPRISRSAGPDPRPWGAGWRAGPQWPAEDPAPPSGSRHATVAGPVLR